MSSALASSGNNCYPFQINYSFPSNNWGTLGPGALIGSIPLARKNGSHWNPVSQYVGYQDALASTGMYSSSVLY